MNDPSPQSERSTRMSILAVTIWQGLLAAGCAIGIALVWSGGAELKPWLRLVLSVALATAGGAAGISVPMLQRRRQPGRLIALTVNYLLLLVSLFGLLHVLGVFTGIDALGGTFGKGIPWLGGVIAGYLITTIGDRFEHNYDRAQVFRRVGQLIMAVFVVIFLFVVGVVKMFIHLAVQFNRPLPFVLLGGLVVTSVMLRLLSRPATQSAFRTKTFTQEAISGFLFLSPNLLGFLFFFAGPLLFSLYVSFTNWDAFGTQDWIGLQNYREIFNVTIKALDSPNQLPAEVMDVKVYDELTRLKLFGKGFLIGAEDKLFWIALRNTLVFTLLALPLSIIPALLLATLLNSKLPGMKFFRAIYFLPTIAAVVGVALIWQWLYNAAVGYINFSITSVVEFLNSAFNASISDPQIRWLSDTKVALLAVVIMSAWQWIGYYSVIFLAGMQNIPKELYEAATVDGAGSIARFFNVTIPLLAPTTFFVVTTAVISALQIFEQVYVLIPTEPPGGPANSTMTIVLYLYQKGFQRFQQGYASAVAWVLFILIFIVTLAQFQRQRKSGGGAYGSV